MDICEFMHLHLLSSIHKYLLNTQNVAVGFPEALCH